MLRRLTVFMVTLAASCTILIFTAPAASADCTADPGTGEVLCDEEGGENDPGGGGDPGSGGSSTTCMLGDSEIPCSMGGGQWSSTHMCYVIPAPMSPQPGPPAGQADEDGDWHFCIQPPSYQGSNQSVWVESDELLIDPSVLAHRAVAAMNLDPITIGIVPESAPNRVGLVGLPVWMWVDGQTEDTWGPMTRSASEGPVSVTATASVSGVVWDMGDGTKVFCTGPGTPYADHYEKQESPTCGHRYAEMSTDQPDGAYQVTATSHWAVEWTGGGQSGTIELDLTTEPSPIRVGEAQVLTQ